VDGTFESAPQVTIQWRSDGGGARAERWRASVLMLGAVKATAKTGWSCGIVRDAFGRLRDHESCNQEKAQIKDKKKKSYDPRWLLARTYPSDQLASRHVCQSQGRSTSHRPQKSPLAFRQRGRGGTWGRQYFRCARGAYRHRRRPLSKCGCYAWALRALGR